MNFTLYTIHAILILDSSGERIFVKYCQPPHPVFQAGTARSNLYSAVKSQKAFEKGLWEKTKKTNNEIILYENYMVVYKTSIDITIMLIDKHALLENYDLLSLVVNEICDDGIIVETEPTIIASRIARPSFSDVISHVDLSEKGLMNAYHIAKEKLTERILKGNM
ncbi:hypothetical protein MERGE_001960 [Pneumocystis wakefieldiae]|uniref:Coatomer subunit zeta n=1 Tax=Pneumocystis wakefieldiae TaxID=38082 RepID=A0A899FZX1_9ASCO|nr:hypothetical protein MERGE_001960 [Pneumocystis wakefieldiae]